MYDGGYRPDRRYIKCARVVGDVMGKYHPHGDTAIYDALVRMAQAFSLRNPLVDGHGNFGSPGNDPAAAMRYTECRLAPLAMELLRDIDEDTVDFQAELRRPQRRSRSCCRPASRTCWSTARPGIAVGMATNIPPHNLREVIDGVAVVPGATPRPTPSELLEALMRAIKGPDFPTGALIVGPHAASRTPTAPAAARSACAPWSRSRRSRAAHCLVVTELPYQVNPDNLAHEDRRAGQRRQDRAASPTSATRPPSRTGQRLVIVLKRDANAKVVLNNLYKHTQLQTNFGANMVALVDGVPRTLSLDAFIRH